MNSMRRSLIRLSLSVVILLLAGPPVQAQTTANGPYYATPSWDQTLPAATRFIILSNFASAAVLDRETGLVWEKSPDMTSLPWSNARSVCATKNIGGRKGWRLPAFDELASLVDPAVTGPTLPPGHPFTNVQSSNYWSASSLADDSGAAWSVVFSSGGVGTVNKTFGAFVWCVRGGAPLSEY